MPPRGRGMRLADADFASFFFAESPVSEAISPRLYMHADSASWSFTGSLLREAISRSPPRTCRLRLLVLHRVSCAKPSRLADYYRKPLLDSMRSPHANSTMRSRWQAITCKLIYVEHVLLSNQIMTSTPILVWNPKTTLRYKIEIPLLGAQRYISIGRSRHPPDR